MVLFDLDKKKFNFFFKTFKNPERELKLKFNAELSQNFKIENRKKLPKANIF